MGGGRRGQAHSAAGNPRHSDRRGPRGQLRCANVSSGQQANTAAGGGALDAGGRGTETWAGCEASGPGRVRGRRTDLISSCPGGGAAEQPSGYPSGGGRPQQAASGTAGPEVVPRGSCRRSSGLSSGQGLSDSEGSVVTDATACSVMKVHERDWQRHCVSRFCFFNAAAAVVSQPVQFC